MNTSSGTSYSLANAEARRGLEPEARVVVSVAQHDQGVAFQVTAGVDPRAHQRRADAAALPGRKDGHGPQKVTRAPSCSARGPPPPRNGLPPPTSGVAVSGRYPVPRLVAGSMPFCR